MNGKNDLQLWQVTPPGGPSVLLPRPHPLGSCIDCGILPPLSLGAAANRWGCAGRDHLSDHRRPTLLPGSSRRCLSRVFRMSAVKNDREILARDGSTNGISDNIILGGALD